MAVTASFPKELTRIALPLSPHVNQLALAGGGPAETATVPAGASFVAWSATGDFAVRSGGTAVYPAADITDGTGSFPNPAYSAVRPGETISVIAGASACIVALAYYAAPPVGR